LFIHRDFQSRNILIHDSEAWIIDFQGGRLGPALYDIVSFLWQARANFPDSVRRQLLSYYTNTLAQNIQIPGNLLDTHLDYIIIFRMLQVLGAYGFRGLIQHNQRFITHIPQALKCLSDSLKRCNNKFPYLAKIIDSLADSHITDSSYCISNRPALTVTVYSFSYKKGIPADNSGNGGGFVFDCRAIHNPGRYDRYKQLTGNDLPVIEFLEQDGEITGFLDHCKALVDASVQRYISRGFTNLSVSFGCTGGQHRSVYSASHMAAHIAEHFGIHVRLIHREQNITKEFNP
ncbi:MAG: phosphotransferase, partial [Muribaculaceae bacterium]|nr:phosphotransferase [Muribaculaceae bacterium]